MSKLPKSIIKKYGISKKAWAVFRETKSKTTQVKTMAKRKHFSRTRRSFKRSYNAVSTPKLSVMDVLLAGAIYGAVRKPIAERLPTFFSFGPVDSDNVILAGAGFLLSKQKNKLMKSVGLIAMGTEAGIVASNATAGMLNGNSTTATNVTQNVGW